MSERGHTMRNGPADARQNTRSQRLAQSGASAGPRVVQGDPARFPLREDLRERARAAHDVMQHGLAPVEEAQRVTERDGEHSKIRALGRCEGDPG